MNAIAWLVFIITFFCSISHVANIVAPVYFMLICIFFGVMSIGGRK